MMHWQSLSEFLTMGGHGPFVFGAYALVILALALELIGLNRAIKRLKHKEP